MMIPRNDDERATATAISSDRSSNQSGDDDDGDGVDGDGDEEDGGGEDDGDDLRSFESD